jgi:excisionase family DNA binding protein
MRGLQGRVIHQGYGSGLLCRTGEAMQRKTLLTVPQAAQRMTISNKSTWRMVYAKKLEVVRIGRSVRVTAESVDDIIDHGTSPPTRKGDDDDCHE